MTWFSSIEHVLYRYTDENDVMKAWDALERILASTGYLGRGYVNRASLLSMNYAEFERVVDALQEISPGVEF